MLAITSYDNGLTAASWSDSNQGLVQTNNVDLQDDAKNATFFLSMGETGRGR